MSGVVSQAPGVQAVLEEELAPGEAADPGEVAEADQRLEQLLQQVAEPAAAEARAPTSDPAAEAAPVVEPLAGVAMRTAWPVRVQGGRVTVRLRGRDDEVEAELAPGMSAELVQLAVRNGDLALLECVEGGRPLVVGVVQTRIPDDLVLKARTVHIEGEEEVLLRSGRGALRLRQDGEVDIAGSRISAMSRGLLRLVGRVLRLN